MRSPALAAVVLAILASVSAGLGPNHRRAVQVGVRPGLSWWPDTIKPCTTWFDYVSEKPNICEQLTWAYDMSDEDFLFWNPSLEGNCDNVEVGFSYCVEAPTRAPPTPPPQSSSSSSSITSLPPPSRTSSSTTLTASTPTKPSNGIPTPTNIQPGMIDSCSKFFLALPGDTCASVSAASSISLADFLLWNPTVGGERCRSLWADAYVCVGILSGGAVRVTTPAAASPTAATPTRAGNGVSTPSPVQPGMVGNCKTFYFVKKGESCYTIAGRSGVSLEQVVRWNAGAGKDCMNLWAETWACIGVL